MYWSRRPKLVCKRGWGFVYSMKKGGGTVTGVLLHAPKCCRDSVLFYSSLMNIKYKILWIF